MDGQQQKERDEKERKYDSWMEEIGEPTACKVDAN